MNWRQTGHADAHGVAAEIEDPHRLVRRLVHRGTLEFQAAFIKLEEDVEQYVSSARAGDVRGNGPDV